MSRSAFRAVADLPIVTGAGEDWIWRERRGRFGGEELRGDISGGWWLVVASIICSE